MYPDPKASRINEQIDAWFSAVETLRPRWDSVEGLYNVDPGAVNRNVVEGLEAYCYSIWRAKADKLIGDCVSALGSPSPMVQCIPLNPRDETKEPLEKLIDQILGISGFKRITQQAFVKAANCNMGPFRIYPIEENGVITGFGTDWFDPRDFFLYPSDVEHIKDATSVGHRFWESRASIKEKVKAKIYKAPETDVPTSGTPNTYTELPGEWDIMSSINEYADGDDMPVELFDVITRTEKGLRRMVVVRDSDIVLLDEEYPYPVIWYSMFRYLRSEKRALCNGSLGASVADYCLQHSDMLNTLMGGALQTAYPTIYTVGATGSVSVQRLQPGEMINLPEGTQIGAIPNAFRADLVLPVIVKLEEMIEQTLGISAISTGKMPGQETKATTVNVLAANDAQRKASYLDALSEGLEEAANIVLEYLRIHWDELSPDFTEAYPELVENTVWRTRRYRFEVTGKSGDSNPEVMLARLTKVIELAAIPNSPFDASKVAVEMVKILNLPIPMDYLMSDQFTQVMRMLTELQQNGIPPEAVIQAGVTAIMDQINAGGATDMPQPGVSDVPAMPVAEGVGSDGAVTAL